MFIGAISAAEMAHSDRKAFPFGMATGRQNLSCAGGSATDFAASVMKYRRATKLSLLLCLFFVLVALAPAMHAQDITYQCQAMGQLSSQDCPAYNICYQIQQNYNTRWGFCAADGSGFSLLPRRVE